MNSNINGSPDSAHHLSLQFFDFELRADGIVWLRRNSVAYETTSDVHRAYDQFLSAVDDWVLQRPIAPGQLGTTVRA